MNFKHEYDEQGNHTLTILGNGNKSSGLVSYRTPAVVQSSEPDRWYVCCTDYYKDSQEFPEPDKLYMVTRM